MKKYFSFSIASLFAAYFGYSQNQKQLEDASIFAFNIYKQIHQDPELGKREFKTAALIIKELEQIGFTKFHSVPNLETCVIASFDTRKSGVVQAFRADMDGLRGKEKTGLPYASKTDTTMHSCGHDAHVSIVLATARLLYQLRESLKGKFYFIFQPAEEIKGGADDIVESGILQRLKIERMFALHCTNNYSVGRVSISPGYMMAGSSYFTIRLKGKGSHAARPFEGNHIPDLAGRIVSTISAIPAIRMEVTQRPCVISVTHLEAIGDASNKIPDSATIKGTIRAFERTDSPYRGKPSIRELIEREVKGLCENQGVNCTITITKGSPPTKNDAVLFNSIISNLTKVFSGVVDTSLERFMTSEDFSYYTESIPCLYFGLGVSKDNLGFADVHTDVFSVHPDAFQFGIELFCDIAMGIISQGQ